MAEGSNRGATTPRSALAVPVLHRFARALPPLLLAITQLFVASLARAEPELTLRWSTPQAGASCPDQTWAEQRMAEQLGRSAKIDVARRVNAIVTISTRPTGFTLDLATEVNGSTGTRTIEGAECTELSEAAILIIALSVTEASDANATPPASGAVDTPPKPPVRPAEVKPTASASDRNLRYAARLDLVVALGLWHHEPALGPGLAFGLERGMFRAELAGFWIPPHGVEQDGKQVDVSLGAARFTGCFLFGHGHVRGGPCLGGELGGVHSRNPASSVQDNSWWAALFVGARLQAVLFSRLSLVLEADVIGALSRPSFASHDDQTNETTTLYTSWKVQPRAMVGPELRF